MLNDRNPVWVEDLEIMVSALSLFKSVGVATRPHSTSYPIELLVLVKLYFYIDMILYSSPIIAKLIHSTSSAGLS